MLFHLLLNTTTTDNNTVTIQDVIYGYSIQILVKILAFRDFDKKEML